MGEAKRRRGAGITTTDPSTDPNWNCLERVLPDGQMVITVKKFGLPNAWQMGMPVMPLADFDLQYAPVRVGGPKDIPFAEEYPTMIVSLIDSFNRGMESRT